MNEIGGDFYLEEKPYTKVGLLREDKRNRFLLSGRTALDYIIKDMKKEHSIRTIHLPSYCCSSMVEPFKANHIETKFYKVKANPEGGMMYKIPNISKNEALFIIKYFGYNQDYPEDIYNDANKGYLMIEDQTHSVFNSDNFSHSNYTFASLRKWIYVSGFAIATKLNSDFLLPVVDKKHIDYINLRNRAANLKKNYLSQGYGNKKFFLDSFKHAEELLDKDYSEYLADPNAVKIVEKYNFQNLKDKRRANARILLEGLRNIKDVQIIFNSIGNDDCPLCVPILVKNHRRDELHKYLISRKIYCPIHWPKPPAGSNLSSESLALYIDEISLICDQRYDTEDMIRITHEIQRFFKYEVGDLYE